MMNPYRKLYDVASDIDVEDGRSLVALLCLFLLGILTFVAVILFIDLAHRTAPYLAWLTIGGLLFRFGLFVRRLVRDAS